MQSYRLFYAAWPDRATSKRLQSMQLRAHGAVTHCKDFHVTLLFLGAQDSTLVPVFQDIVAPYSRLELSLLLDRIGYFRHNRIAWLGMSSAVPALAKLHQELIDGALRRSLSFPPSGVFRPHVTLARHADAPDDSPFAPVVWRTERIALARSVTGSAPHYHVLEPPSASSP